MPGLKNIYVSWFSAGVSSAVATKMVIDELDHIIYIHIDDQHEDTMRFVKDCEQWFQKEITILQSEYFNSVEEVCRHHSFVRGPHGAKCTGELKKAVRNKWECENRFFNYFKYVWGMDLGESDRAERIKDEQWESEHVFPLIDNSMTKAHTHGILRSAGIERPAMYKKGYQNNNCVGCVKGGMAYWNKIRVDFPEVFNSRAIMERDIGGTSIKGVYLDNLDPERGRGQPPVVEKCGIFCSKFKGVV